MMICEKSQTMSLHISPSTSPAIPMTSASTVTSSIKNKAVIIILLSGA